MLEQDKEIDAALAKVVGISLDALNRKGDEEPSAKRRFSIRNILLVSTAYDYFLLEEEGRLSELFKKVYVQRDLGYIPTIKHYGTGSSALKALDGDWFDLLVIFNPPSDMSLFNLAKEAKKRSPKLTVIYLANNTPELNRIAGLDTEKDIDRIFTWQGDGEVFIGIVELIEDFKNSAMRSRSGSSPLLLVESDISSYSQMIPLIYKEIWKNLETVLGGDLTHAQRLAKVRMRPRLLLATSDSEASSALKSSLDDFLCIVADSMDLKGPRIYLDHKGTFADLWSKMTNAPPLLIMNSDGCGWEESQAKLVRRDSPGLLAELKEFVAHNLGNENLTFTMSDGRTYLVGDVMSLERALYSMPDAVLEEHVRKGDIRRWLTGRLETDLAKGFERLSAEKTDTKELKRSLLSLIEDHKLRVHQGSVANYSRRSYGPHVRFSRIGMGPMGGKAHGLAFIDKILATYVRDNIFPGVKIGIPRTLVICTDVFEHFIEQNNILSNGLLSQPDERIAAAFQEGSLPMTVLGDLRAFVEDAKGPLIVRSSSLLEDAFFQPFAGIYSSVMLANSSFEPDVRFQELVSAIKFVYASTYFEKARIYIRSTPNQVEDEKMGVIVQEVMGKRHGRVFYPDVSGVARSYDYWPSSRCRNTDGTVNLALGLGKTIVDGGMTYRFCPVHPDIANYGSVQDLLKQSQTKFYAINLDARKKLLEEDDTLVQLGLETAERDGTLFFTASTYSAENDRLFAGIGREGPRVLDFAPLLQYETVPLPGIVQLMLRLSEISLGCPVEIEFAMNLDQENGVPAEFAFLQVRSMVAKSGIIMVRVDDYPKKDIFCQTDNAMGNDIITDITDIVYIDPRDFDMGRSQEAVQSLRKLNAELIKQGKRYLLIGPGRWGSKEPWLGIPVAWGDISGAKVIVETPLADRVIDPSQGSHFFQNLSSLRLGYFTMKPNFAAKMDWKWLKKLAGTTHSGDVSHVTLSGPIEIRIDGRTGRAVILKRNGNDKKEEL
jgi:hypothetical protein